MSVHYKETQQKVEVSKFVIYVPCSAHSVSFVGRGPLNCCQEAVYLFFTVQLLYIFFQSSFFSHNQPVDHCKGCIRNLCHKVPPGYQMGGTCYGNSNKFEIVEALISRRQATKEEKKMILQIRYKIENSF